MQVYIQYAAAYNTIHCVTKRLVIKLIGTHLSCPVVCRSLCCDLNSLPDSSVVEYLRTGRIATSHRDLQGHGYDGFLQRFSASVRGGIRAPSGKPELVHQFNLRRTYSGQMEYTNFTFDFKGVIDYIFYSADFLTPHGACQHGLGQRV